MRKILVVDDEAAARMMLCDYLRDRGCLVLEAGDGAEAFALAERDRPDLIIMDVEMPRIDGMSAAGVLHEAMSTAGIPILLYTGKERDKVAQMLAFGTGLRYLSKPSEFGRIWECVEEMLS